MPSGRAGPFAVWTSIRPGIAGRCGSSAAPRRPCVLGFAAMSETRRSDDGVRARVVALLDELGERQPLLSVTDLSARLGVVQGVLADRVVDLAVTESGRQRLRAELRGRRWAEERRVGAPAVLGAHEDGRWLGSGRGDGAPAGGAPRARGRRAAGGRGPPARA